MRDKFIIASRRGASLVELMIGVTIIALVVWFCSGPGLNRFRAVLWRHEIVGTVVGAPGIKIKIGEGEESKFSVNINTEGGPMIVNCSSTQCGGFLVGQRVQLSCYEEFHPAEPNEEECRFVRLLPE